MREKRKFTRTLKSRKKLIVFVLFILVLMIYYNLVNDLFTITRNEYSGNFSAKKNFKNILYWQTMFGDEDMSLGLGSEIFQNCYYTNCFATSNRSYLPVEEFDVVVFHGAEYHRYFWSSWVYRAPSKRSPDQIYAFLSLEAPTSSYINYVGPHHFYNWTITYRTDSDVHRPYGYIVSQRSNYTTLTVDEIAKKKKKIAWFVSHCETKGKREILHEKMAKFMPIDVYGSCGKLSCSARDPDRCYKMIEQDYKFYLSFENSICEDYVTEKLFRILRYNIVPVVFGGANYSRIAPPHSVINVQEFKSTKNLMDYLQFLDDNPREYQKYFEWKRNYGVVTRPKAAVCELCRKLNEDRDEKKSIYNIYDWLWGQDRRKCRNEWIDTFT